jgi:hypothetical protein
VLAPPELARRVRGLARCVAEAHPPSTDTTASSSVSGVKR